MRTIGMISLILLMSLSTAVFSEPHPDGDELVISRDYVFSRPEIVQVKNTELDRVNMDELPLESVPGVPVVPVKPLRILIPAGYQVEAVKVEGDGREKVAGFYRLEIGQQIIPYSFNREELKRYREFFQIESQDHRIYESARPYPGKLHTLFNIQSMRGYQMLCMKLYPVEYVPVRGEVFFLKNMKLTLTCRSRKTGNGMLRNTGFDADFAAKFADNPEVMKSYRTPSANTGDGRYLIVSSKALIDYAGENSFHTLAEFLRKRALTVKIVDIETILAQAQGKDDAMKLRNYIREAYQNHGTEYVLLGGDCDASGEGKVIPIRSLYAKFIWEGRTFEENLPADVYYSCLDGTFDFDGDSQYGEPGDGENGGEVDLLAEVFVGRAPVSNTEELSNFVRKTMAAYSYNDRKVLFVGENLFPGIWGKSYMNEIRDGAGTHGFKTVGFSDHWNKDTLYDRDSVWEDSSLIGRINEGVTIVNHIGHCSATYAMKLIRYDVPLFKNEKFCLIYSQGCHAGQFTKKDCLMEMLMNHKYGTFAVIANSSYGLGPEDPDPDSSVITRGASQYFNRQFADAIFNEGINRVGPANQDSKEDNLHWMDHGTTRWVFWELNLMGDPHLPVN